MTKVDIDNHIPHVRPHIRRREGSLFFMISRRACFELSGNEALLYDSIDGRRTVAELERLYVGARNQLLSWREAAIIELIAPVVSPTGPHLVVVEPHMDDAVLSAGGRLLHRRGQNRITILSVVRWSNFTSYLVSRRNFLNVQEISDIRQRESVLAARFLGAQHRCLNWTDAPLRICPSERWSPQTVEEFNKAPQDFVKGFPNPKEVSLLAEQLLRELSILMPDELWIPMGLGDHLDHRTTRSACLMMLVNASNQLLDVPVFMYEDLPYAAEPGHAGQIRVALANCGTRLIRATEDIADVLEEKVRLSSIYASQFKSSYIEPMIRGFAEREGAAAGTFAEAYHRIDGKCSLPAEVHLSRDWSGLADLQKRLRSLLPKRVRLRRLAVMALPSGNLGKWTADSESLVAAFPKTDLCVYVSSELAWQYRDHGKSQIRLEIVDGGWIGWVRVLWREILRVGTPTVVMWRGAYSATPPLRTIKRFLNTVIRLLLPLRPVLFTRGLSDLCGILNEQVAGADFGHGPAKPQVAP